MKILMALMAIMAAQSTLGEECTAQTGAREFHVSVNGHDTNDGGPGTPLKTISAAAEKAHPGDTITVHEGVYRERINPPRGGTSDDRRITYQAAPGAKVVIKGSEPITGWSHVESNTWSVTISNRFFGDYNPYQELIQGAWFEAKRPFHPGAVYLNGHWLKEAAKKADVVTSLSSGVADEGRDELMNIQSVRSAGTGLRPVDTVLAGKSDDIGLLELKEGKKAFGRMKENSYLIVTMDFGAEPSDNFAMYAASPVAGGIVELRRDGPGGDLLGRVDVGFTAEWHHFQAFHASMIKPLTGIHSICLLFKARPVVNTALATDLGYWFAEVDDEHTTIWADFKGKDPNREFVEINVRQSVFYPEREGVDYITVRGFTMEQAAAPWVTPTAEQVGLIGTHWSRGWIIESNTIRYSSCVGVTLGKHGDEHDHTFDYARTTIPKAIARGWDQVGHHIVRDNHIYHCGQGGIQGSLGCAFSTITGNEIHDIRKAHTYGGAETAGIKLHGAVDVVIADNHVYNCEHWGGIWLDWMAQGARISGNLLHDNSQDLMFEVNHGPHLVDHNILLSARGITEASGGGAFAHNLWSGRVNIWPSIAQRFTPYFKPHSVEIIGSNNVNQDDDRFYNNLFTGGSGTATYDEHGFAITADGNVFTRGAEASKHDQNPVMADGFDPGIQLTREEDGWWLVMKMDPAWRTAVSRSLVDSELLGRASRPDAPFTQRDGMPYRLVRDYFGASRNVNNLTPGPFAGPEEDIRVKVWPKPLEKEKL